MDSEGYLPQSHFPVTSPYTEPPRSCPHTHIPLPEDRPYYYPPFTAGSPEWSLSFRFSPQKPVYASPLLHTRYMALKSLLNLITCTIFGE